MRERDIAAVLDALDGRKPGTVADINGAAPDLAIALHRRFGVHIALIGLDDGGRITPLPLDAREEYVARLAAAGVPPERIGHLARSSGGKFDLVISVDGFGYRSDINRMKDFLEERLAPGGRLLIELSATAPPCAFLKIEADGPLRPPTAAAAGLALMVAAEEPLCPGGKTATGNGRDRGTGGNVFFRDRSEDDGGLLMQGKGAAVQSGHGKAVLRGRPPGEPGRLARLWRRVMTWAGMQGPGA